MLSLTVTEEQFEKPFRINRIVAPTKSLAITELVTRYPDARFEKEALRSLLSLHDDIRIGGPIWNVRFEFDFLGE